MLHKLLNITRNLFSFDVESTGTNPATDRIVELAFDQYDASGLVKSWSSRVNPGMPIPPAATAIHHITDEMMRGCGQCGAREEDHTIERRDPDSKCVSFKPIYTFKQLAPSLAKGLVNCDFAGQNVRFDLRILAAEFARVNVPWSYAGARILDSSKLEQLAVPRSLSHLYEKYVRKTCVACSGIGTGCPSCGGEGDIGVKHDSAHGALSDVRAAATVISKQLETHATLPRDLDALHKLSWPGWVDAQGLIQMRNGEAVFTFGKHRDKPIRIDRDYLVWLGGPKSGFSDEMRKIANDAARGIFPEEKK